MIGNKFDLPAIGIGTWGLGDKYWGEQSHSNSLKTIHSAMREGFRLFDTAPVYGNGQSEQILGQQLSKKRDRVILSSKCFLKPIPQVEKSFKNSLSRLNTDYIDIFFIHWPSSKLDCRPMVELLEKYRSQGKIRKIGLSNFNKKELDLARTAGNIDIVQNGYNLLWTKEQKFFEYCSSLGIKTQSYATIAQGLLTGKFSAQTPYITKDDLKLHNILFNPNNIGIVYEAIEKLTNISNAEGLSLYDVVIAWTLNNQFLDSILVGCRTRSQVEALNNARKITLSPQTVKIIDNISRVFNNIDKSANNIFNHFY